MEWMVWVILRKGGWASCKARTICHITASGEFWLRSVHDILSERKNASSQRVSSAANERCVRHPPWVWKRRFWNVLRWQRRVRTSEVTEVTQHSPCCPFVHKIIIVLFSVLWQSCQSLSDRSGICQDIFFFTFFPPMLVFVYSTSEVGGGGFEPPKLPK